MVSDPVLQWVLTIAFGATGLYAIVRIGTDRLPLVVIGHVLHLIMSAAMVAMSWPWWSVIPVIPQVVVFGTGALWFALLATLQATRRVRRVDVGGHGPWHQGAHAIMMLAMVWMTVSMGTGSGASADGGHGAHDNGSLPLWASLSGVVITAALVVAGVLFLVDFIVCLRGRRTWLGHTGDVASGAVMSLGMAIMCWLMIAG